MIKSRYLRRYSVRVSWDKVYGNWYLGAYLHQVMRTLSLQMMLGHRLLTLFIYVDEVSRRM